MHQLQNSTADGDPPQPTPGLLINQRSQRQLQALTLRGTQRHQAHSGADLISHPTEQIALAQGLRLNTQTTASPAPGRRPAQIQGAIGQGPAQLSQQLQERAAHLPLLLAQLESFALRQQPTIKIAELCFSAGFSSSLPLLQPLLHGFQRSGLQPHDPWRNSASSQSPTSCGDLSWPRCTSTSNPSE